MRTLSARRIFSVFSLPLKLPSSFLRTSAIGPLGVYAYLIGVALPLQTDIALAILTCCSLVAVGVRKQLSVTGRFSLYAPVVLFLLATSLSTLGSHNIHHSLRLTMVLVPATLLFLVITDYDDEWLQLDHLYLVFSLVGLGLSLTVLWMGWQYRGISPKVWVPILGSPLLIVPNDGVFLAAIAPFSLVLLYRTSHSLVNVVTGFSLFSSIGAVVVLRSRVAALTLCVAVSWVATLLQPRLGLLYGGMSLLALGLVDLILGFPLLGKFAQWDTRLSLWFLAWGMFLDAPLVGHGPHTFGLLYQSYRSRLQLPEWLPLDPHTTVPWAHNLYLELLAEQGLIGLSTFLLLLGWGMRLGWTTHKSARDEVRIFAVAALAVLGSLGVASVLELTLMRQWVAILLFTVLGIITRLSFQQLNKGGR